MNTCQQHTAKFRGAISRPVAKSLILTVLLVLSLVSAALAQQVPLINQPLSPEQAVPGAKQVTLTVDGTGFDSDAVVKWNGTALVTTFKTQGQVTAVVPTADLATAGTANVTVENGSGVSSNVAHFQIVKPGYTVSYSKLDYATDTAPQDVTTGDFNGDGNPDLAVATGNNSVSILLGNSTGTFPTHVQYAVPGNPVAIISGDFTGSGKIDLATADQYSSQISVLLGNGDGTFQGHVEYAVGAKPVALATADVNGDGKLDIVVANANNNTVSVLLGNGDGTFQAQKTYATGNAPYGVAIGDFNGDGKLDLAVVNSSDSTVSILLGNGDGTFQTGVPYATAIGANSVVAGCFHGSGILDLAVGTSNKSVSVLLGNGNGTFQNHKEYSIGANAVVVAAADLNASGHLALISANYNDNTVSTLEGTGTGTFNSQSVFPTNVGPTGLAVADFNGNGKLDVAAAASGGNVVSILTDSWEVLSPSTYSFGTQTSGEKSSPKTFVLKNGGTTPYTMGTISFVGASNTDFTQTNTCPAAGATLAAGASCDITVTFEPTASEYADSVVEITQTNGSVIGAQVTGSGNVPITLAPRNITFTWQLLNTKSIGKTNTFTNDSGVDIYFTKIDLEGANPTEFSFTTTCAGGDFNYSVPLAPGASCTSTIYYTPNATGDASITEVYYGSMTLGKQGTLIQGESTAVTVTPASITFPSTAVGATSTSVVTIKNAASTALPLSSATFVNGTANVFTIQSNTCGYTGQGTGSVPANGSCTFTLAFTPTVAGTETATFSIGDSDPDGPQQVKLTGTGTT